MRASERRVIELRKRARRAQDLANREFMDAFPVGHRLVYRWGGGHIHATVVDQGIGDRICVAGIMSGRRRWIYAAQVLPIATAED
jgi:hypothetical protein